MSIGGDLLVENIFYADCGNSVIQVNGDFRSKVLFISQCSVEVRGEEKADYNEEVTIGELESIGLDVSEQNEAEEAIRAYFESREK